MQGVVEGFFGALIVADRRFGDDLKRRRAADGQEPARGAARQFPLGGRRHVGRVSSMCSQTAVSSLSPSFFQPRRVAPTVNRIAMRSQPAGANLSVFCRPILALISPFFIFGGVS